MKKIQVLVSNELHKAVKLKAVQEEITISEVVIELLKQWLKTP